MDLPVPQTFERPKLSEADKAAILLAARKINAIRDERVRMTYVIAFMLENAQLTQEVNALRGKLGLPSIPTYNPNSKK